MALNTVVSESVDIVVQCTRTTDGPSDEAPTTEDPHLHGDRGVPALGWIAGGDGSPAMQAAWTLANAGHDVRLLPTCMSASPGQAASRIIADGSFWPLPGRPGDRRDVGAGHADLGELGRRYLSRASAVTPASSWSTVVNPRLSATARGCRHLSAIGRATWVPEHASRCPVGRIGAGSWAADPFGTQRSPVQIRPTRPGQRVYLTRCQMLCRHKAGDT